ncbi:4-hydroxyphenylacetate decarboxylase small subunit [Clostridium gasigenes]
MKLLQEQNMRGFNIMCRENMKHSDCSNFCPIDAAKGI